MKHNQIGLMYEAINTAETFAELSHAILKCADKDGNIQGRKIKFNAEEASQICLNLRDAEFKNFRLLTREFGIRQQAIYLDYYKSE